MTETATLENQTVVLRSMPEGSVELDHFESKTEPVPELTDGNILVGVEWISIDAFIRTTFRPGGFHQETPVGAVVGALGAGRVLASKADGYNVGDGVKGPVGAQTHVVAPAAMFEVCDETLAPLQAHLSALGLTTGMTAWVGVRNCGAPKPGETFVVSAAAGAVGSIAGQIAKKDGAKVIGIAGGPDKVAFLTDQLGFDGAIDYRNEDVAERLRELAPNGVDVFFDNVGGEILDIVLDQLALRGRVTICGAISQYERTGEVVGPSMYLRLAERQARMEGFAVFHFPDSFPQAISELAQWYSDGSLIMNEQVFDGIDAFPEALLAMFQGKNIGKILVRV